MKTFYCKEHNCGGTVECHLCLEKKVQNPHDLGWALSKASELGYERGLVSGKRDEFLRIIKALSDNGIMDEVAAYKLLKDVD